MFFAIDIKNIMSHNDQKRLAINFGGNFSLNLLIYLMLIF